MGKLSEARGRFDARRTAYGVVDFFCFALRFDFRFAFFFFLRARFPRFEDLPLSFRLRRSCFLSSSLRR